MSYNPFNSADLPHKSERVVPVHDRTPILFNMFQTHNETKVSALATTAERREGWRWERQESYLKSLGGKSSADYMQAFSMAAKPAEETAEIAKPESAVTLVKAASPNEVAALSTAEAQIGSPKEVAAGAAAEAQTVSPKQVAALATVEAPKEEAARSGDIEGAAEVVKSEAPLIEKTTSSSEDHHRGRRTYQWGHCHEKGVCGVI